SMRFVVTHIEHRQAFRGDASSLLGTDRDPAKHRRSTGVLVILHSQKVPSALVLGREDEERVTVISQQMRHPPALLIERKPVRSQTAIDDLKILVSSICRDQNRSAG